MGCLSEPRTKPERNDTTEKSEEFYRRKRRVRDSWRMDETHLKVKWRYLHPAVDKGREQDHRGVKRITRPMLGFKSFAAAQATLTGIDLIWMLRQGKLDGGDMEELTVAEQVCKLAA